MKRFLPFLILAGGAVGLYLLWSRIFGAPAKTADQAGGDAVSKFRDECAAKGGTLQFVGTGGITNAAAVSTNDYGCRMPDIPVGQLKPGAYGGCPDRLSCAGQTSPDYAGSPTHPQNAPTPAASAPTGSSSLYYIPTGRGIPR